jgi:hypothetical protein
MHHYAFRALPPSQVVTGKPLLARSPLQPPAAKVAMQVAIPVRPNNNYRTVFVLSSALEHRATCSYRLSTEFQVYQPGSRVVVTGSQIMPNYYRLFTFNMKRHYTKWPPQQRFYFYSAAVDQGGGGVLEPIGERKSRR